MYNIKFHFVTIFCLFLVYLPKVVLASDVYTISELKISATASNATDARIMAMEAGQLKAFNLLLNNLWLDKSPAIIASKIATIPKQNIFSLVRDYSISEEKISSSTYRAILEVSFNSQLVNNLLQAPARAVVTQTERQLKVKLTLKIKNLQQWLQYKKILVNHPLTKNFNLISLSTSKAIVEISTPLVKYELEKILIL